MTTCRIGIALATWNSVSTRILAGIRREVTSQQLDWDWEVASSDEAVQDLLDEQIDGWLIGPGFQVSVPDGVPCLPILEEDQPTRPRLAAVVDQQAVGALAARHLHARGYRQAAVYVFRATALQAERADGFRAACTRLGVAVDEFDSTASDGSISLRDQQVAAWLTGLPDACGIFCCTDHSASWIRSCCARWGHAIPSRFGLVGAGDLPSACLAKRPELSSVPTPWQGLGAAAVTGLCRLLAGDELGELESLRPVSVVARASTDRALGGSPLAQRAMRYVRRHLQRDHSFAHIAKQLQVSTATLARHVHAATGQGLIAWREGQRIERACTLIGDEPLSLQQVARRCGYPKYPTFYRAFRRHISCSPEEYRKQVAEE